MPRLVGPRSNTGAFLMLLLVLVAAALIVLEWSGAINLISNVGAI